MRKLSEISPSFASYVVPGLVSTSFSWGAACLILHHRSIPFATGTELFGRITKRVLDSVHFGLSLVVNPTRSKSEQGVSGNRRERPTLIFGASFRRCHHSIVLHNKKHENNIIPMFDNFVYLRLRECPARWTRRGEARNIQHHASCSRISQTMSRSRKQK